MAQDKFAIHRPPAMSSMGVVLDRIRERRVRQGCREALLPRERIPPDLVEPCRRYPLTAFLCILATVGAVVAVIVLFVVMLITAGSTPTPVAKPKARPGAPTAVSPRR
jgi:hypothetical protein